MPLPDEFPVPRLPRVRGVRSADAPGDGVPVATQAAPCARDVPRPDARRAKPGAAA